MAKNAVKSVFGHSFVMQYLVSFLVLQSYHFKEEKRRMILVELFFSLAYGCSVLCLFLTSQS